MDDCFCINKKECIDHVVSHLNRIKNLIQFTMEDDVDSQLPFLDVLIKWVDRRLAFAAHIKPTHTGRLHFNSVHPATHKRSVVSTLL